MSTLGTVVVVTALITAAILVMVCVCAALSHKEQEDSERFIV